MIQLFIFYHLQLNVMTQIKIRTAISTCLQSHRESDLLIGIKEKCMICVDEIGLKSLMPMTSKHSDKPTFKV